MKRIATILLCAQLGGCALVSRGETLHVRYFTLDAARSAPAGAQPKPELELRLGRVDASGALGELLAVRTGQNEVTYREDRRWTERPTQFVRRGLERALFEERGLTRAYSGVAPTLDVELVELETDQAGAPSGQARVRLLTRLHDDRRGLCNDSFAASEPLTDVAQVEASVASLSQALERSLEQLAARVVQCLERREPPGTPPDAARASKSE